MALAHWEQLQEETSRWLVRERHRPRRSSGVEALDHLLAGGWPVGKVGELLGPVSSGKTSLAARTVAQATGKGELCLWVDACGELDAPSLAACGVWLEALLVVRVREIEQAVRATELVLAAGGFTTVVVDLGGWKGEKRGYRGKERWHLPLRLARAVEGAGVVGLVLAEAPWMGTWAATRVIFSPAQPRFVVAEGSPPWFAGWHLRASLQRGQGVQVGKELAWAMGA
jgi:hypothetical protein